MKAADSLRKINSKCSQICINTRISLLAGIAVSTTSFLKNPIKLVIMGRLLKAHFPMLLPNRITGVTDDF